MTDINKKTTTTEIATFDYGSAALDGYDLENNKLRVPALGIIQPKTTKEELKEHVGKLINSQTSEIYDEVRFIPVKEAKRWVEKTPFNPKSPRDRKTIKEYTPDAPEVAAALKDSEARGFDWNKPKIGKNDLVETYYLLGLIVSDDDMVITPARMTFTSTNIKVYKQLHSRLIQCSVPGPQGRVKPPIYAHQLRVASTKSGSAGDEYYNFKIQPWVDNDTVRSLLDPKGEIFAAARELAGILRDEERFTPVAAEQDTMESEPYDDHQNSGVVNNVPF